MIPIDFFMLGDVALPSVAIEKNVPASLAKDYDRLQALLPPIHAAREKLRAGLNPTIASLVKKFTTEALEELRSFRYGLLRLAQAEVDVRDAFEGWLNGYQEALTNLHEQAKQARAKAAADVRTRMLEGAGFDDAAKGEPAKADPLIELHPSIRKASAQIRQMEESHQPVLDPNAYDERFAGEAVWVAPSSANRARRRELAEAIRSELGQILRTEGLVATVQFAAHLAFNVDGPESEAHKLLSTHQVDELRQDQDLRA